MFLSPNRQCRKYLAAHAKSHLPHGLGFGFGTSYPRGSVSRGGSPLPDPSELSATIDGVELRDLPNYRVASSLFQFTADPALSAIFDPCINGETQDAVTVGYWLWLTPLPPGEHTIHFEAGGLFGQDVTYVITVVPGR